MAQTLSERVIVALIAKREAAEARARRWNDLGLVEAPARMKAIARATDARLAHLRLKEQER